MFESSFIVSRDKRYVVGVLSSLFFILFHYFARINVHCAKYNKIYFYLFFRLMCFARAEI